MIILDQLRQQAVPVPFPGPRSPVLAIGRQSNMHLVCHLLFLALAHLLSWHRSTYQNERWIVTNAECAAFPTSTENLSTAMICGYVVARDQAVKQITRVDSMVSQRISN